MHVAFDFKTTHFEVLVGGILSTRESLLEWEERDRLGVVVDRPFGAMDASLMILLVGTAYYDAKRKRRTQPNYPDTFVFHSGGPWGSNLFYDVVPDYKEVMVAPDPSELLRAINHAGITHLLVPDRPVRQIKHRFKERESALDRIKKAFAYGALGSAAYADTQLSTTEFTPFIETMESTLDPTAFFKVAEELMKTAASTSHTAGLRTVDKAELEIILPHYRRRVSEVSETSPERLRQHARIEAAKTVNKLLEQYRQLDVNTALSMLPTDLPSQ